MVTLRLSKKNVETFTVDQIRSLASIIKWNKVYDAITSDSIDKEFMDKLGDILNKKNYKAHFIMKSSHKDVIDMYSTYLYKGVLTLQSNNQYSEEFILHYKENIRNWRTLPYIFNYNISSNLFDEIVPCIKETEKEDEYYDLTMFKLMLMNNNLSYETVKKHFSEEIIRLYIDAYKSEKFKWSKYQMPSINFLKVYKEYTNWELLMEKAPISVFTKNFVVEFYDKIAPLCISMQNVNRGKINKISQYRKYVKKEK